MPENSQIRAKGVGKNAVRHDLDGTPGLNSDLQQGEVQQLERGQKTVQNTQQAQQVQAAGAPQAPPAPGAGAMQVPDPVQFAGKKLGGGDLSGAGQQVLKQQDFSRWLPLLRRLSTSPTSSGILQRAYVKRLSMEDNRPLGGSATVIRQRDFDKRLEQFNAS